MKVSRWSEGYASDILEAFNGKTSLNMTLKMHPEDTSKLLVTLFNEFALNPDDFDLSVYYPRQRGEEIPLTIHMLISSGRCGKWLYK